MHFLLKSEIEEIDAYKGYLKSVVFCPFCFKIQIKKVEKNTLYNVYSCWNKDCQKRDNKFAVLNDYIDHENAFETECEHCKEPYVRTLDKDNDKQVLLIFKCHDKICELNETGYTYNVNINSWIGNKPKFTLLEDEIGVKPINNYGAINLEETLSMSGAQNEKQDKSTSKMKNEQYINHELPLLTMNCDQYEEFLLCHQHKVVILVDVPNFIRTLRKSYRHNFNQILNKAHVLLLDFIENSFHTVEDYIIRYFSKPDEDLFESNQLLMDFCIGDPKREYFHLLMLEKGKGYSDIDNYIIANGVELLERCGLKGFVIVSSDKDYLPVMRIASYRKVKSYIMGINTSDIYDKYNVNDIKFLSIMRFLKEKK